MPGTVAVFTLRSGVLQRGLRHTNPVLFQLLQAS